MKFIGSIALLILLTLFMNHINDTNTLQTRPNHQQRQLLDDKKFKLRKAAFFMPKFSSYTLKDNGEFIKDGQQKPEFDLSKEEVFNYKENTDQISFEIVFGQRGNTQKVKYYAKDKNSKSDIYSAIVQKRKQLIAQQHKKLKEVQEIIDVIKKNGLYTFNLNKTKYTLKENGEFIKDGKKSPDFNLSQNSVKILDCGNLCFQINGLKYLTENDDEKTKVVSVLYKEQHKHKWKQYYASSASSGGGWSDGYEHMYNSEK